MRHACIGIGTVICLFTAACSGQPLSPTSPSGVAGVSAQTQASGRPPIEVTFTKWITAFPAMEGETGGDVPGTFAGTILRRDPFDNGTIVQLEAEYEVTDVDPPADPAQSFVAHIEGTLNNRTQKAVLNGTVTSGWLVGAQVQVTFDVIAPAPGVSCVPAAPPNTRCFQGTIRILPGSAN